MECHYALQGKKTFNICYNMEIATHFSILTWEIPWTEEPGKLQSMELQELVKLVTEKKPTQHGWTLETSC